MFFHILQQKEDYHMGHIWIMIPFDGDERQKVRELAGEHRVFFADEVGENEKNTILGETEILWGNPSPQELEACPNLRWLQLSSAGADMYIKPDVLQGDILLTNATGAYGLAIAEHMVGVVFALYKKLHVYRDNQTQGIWRDEGAVKSIQGAHVLVVGMGDIGGEFATRMHALGAHVTGICRTPRQTPFYAERVLPMKNLDELLATADIVALCLPGTNQTQGLFNRDRIYTMKKGAVLLNVGRGNAVDTDALYDALADGHLDGAGLDVTQPEPLPADHPLWHMPNAVITPHIAGWYHLRQTLENIQAICLKNLSHYLKGEELENVVDRQLGYCPRRGACMHVQEEEYDGQYR